MVVEMKLAMTMMVRDEADIVSAMLDHHLAQGVDTIIVTDNGSIDGTAEILGDYASRGLIDLRHDPVQRKQQNIVVTQMAREAKARYDADWVINADADEFVIPVDRSMTLRDALEHTPKSIRSFSVPVVNLTGDPALSGTGFERLVWRDTRPDDILRLVGLWAQPTHNAVHVGDADVVVAQGNHFVSLSSRGAPDDAHAIEVLHLPWRSWNQFRNKVEISGRAYESNPELLPSPNHHGMRDYRRLKDGVLLPYYVLRHPSADELSAGTASNQYQHDDYLARTLTSAVADVPLGDAELAPHRAMIDVLQDLTGTATATLRGRNNLIRLLTDHRDSLDDRVRLLEAEVAELRQSFGNRAYAALQRLRLRTGNK